MPKPQAEAKLTREQHERRRVRLATMQADLAYFQARLAMLGAPKTSNQAAQKRTFEVLHQQLALVRGRTAEL